MRHAPFNVISIASILLLVVSGHSVSWAGAQTPQRDNRPRTASIGGRVTVSGAPAANALVTVVEADPQSVMLGVESPQGESIKVRTDNDGRYRVTGLAEGAYVIHALSKAYVLSKSLFGVDAFKSATLDEGESRDDIDIALVRGGVITGRVIDAEARPVIGAGLRLFPVDEKGNPKEALDSNNRWRMFQTDDRGVYRIYGLLAGRYILSAGGEGAPNLVRLKSPEIFYPDATDRARAKIIEVKEGAEVAEIDIRLGAARERYEAAGRVVDAETGKPLPRVSLLCMQAPDKKYGGTLYGIPATTDDEGRFTCAGLDPGRYELSLWERKRQSSEHYSEKIIFEVIDSNLSGLEVKAIRGSTISGVVVIEGVNDPQAAAKLQRMSVGIQGARSYKSPITANLASDGAFRLIGAPAGTVSFYLDGYREVFFIRRIERDGAEIRSAFEVGRGEQLTGFRIVVAQANGTIRGQVESAGVNLPEGCQLKIWATPANTATSNEGMPAYYTTVNGHAVADEKGRFVIEGLPPGEYELQLNAMVRVDQRNWSSAPGTIAVRRRVTVSSGSETMVKLSLDPPRK
jgi:protocatechuate 3,4-dioxygenase beta subunit